MKKIILDTDLCGDCDDAGAIAVLLNLERMGYCKSLCISYNLGEPLGAEFIQHLLDWYGRSDLPFGRLYADFYCGTGMPDTYTRAYCQAHPGKTFPVPEDNLRLLRRTLAENGGVKDITLVTIGGMNTIAALYKSEADDISDKTGLELVSENVCELVAMLGDMANLEHCECNVGYDIPAARYVVENTPCTLTLSGYELGAAIKTGQNLHTLPADHPLYAAYYLHSMWAGKGGKIAHCSFDPLTVYYAVLGLSGLFTFRDNCTISICDKGRCHITEGGSHRYLVQAAPAEKITDALNELFI